MDRFAPPARHEEPTRCDCCCEADAAETVEGALPGTLIALCRGCCSWVSDTDEGDRWLRGARRAQLPERAGVSL